jgi:hypothetical protein
MSDTEQWGPDTVWRRVVAQKWAGARKIRGRPNITAMRIQDGSWAFGEVRLTWKACGPIASLETAKHFVTLKNIWWAPKVLKMSRWKKPYEDYMAAYDEKQRLGQEELDALEKQVLSDADWGLTTKSALGSNSNWVEG